MSIARCTLAEVRKKTMNEKVHGEVLGQVEQRIQKQTRDAKPYLEMHLRDGTGLFTFRVWQDHENYQFLLNAPIGTFIGLTGEFGVNPQFGLEVRHYVARELGPDDVAEVVDGPAAQRQKQLEDYREIERAVVRVKDPRLRRLAELFLVDYGERFQRTAGARHYHHARRGGLVEHVAQMLRTSRALVQAYPNLNADLLCCGILFHDCGKMWENCFPQDSVVMAHDARGELLGHIAIGIEIVNRLWSRLRASDEYGRWRGLTPDSELVHLHLIHLIAAHHGEKEFGSPVEPKTPEAVALHFIDNLDAKLEVMAAAYERGVRLTDQIVERVRPFPTNLVSPLPGFVEPAPAAPLPVESWREAFPADLPFNLPAQ